MIGETIKGWSELVTKNIKSTSRIVLLACAGVLAASEHSMAGAFGINEYGAAGTGLAGAGGATGAAGLGSISLNPATLSLFGGLQTSSTFSYVGPRVSIDAPTGNTGDVANGGRVVPASQFSYQVSDRFWVGLSIDSPFGLVSYIRSNNFASYYGTTTRVVDVDVTPMAAYKITDWLSVGAGLQINYIDAVLDGSLTPLVPGSYLNLNGSDTSLGFKVGALFTPMAGTEIGIGYRSEIRPNLKGTLDTNVPFPGLSGLILPGSQDITLGMVLPAQLNIGVRQKITSDLALAFSYQWTNWKAFDRFTADLGSGPGVPLNFDYRDGWLVALGAEYAWNKATTLRAGINYEQSPITATNRDPRLPDSNRVLVGAGAGYKYSENISLDFAYAHVFMAGGDLDVTTPSNPHFTGVPFKGSSKGSADIASMTLSYKW